MLTTPTRPTAAALALSLLPAGALLLLPQSASADPCVDQGGRTVRVCAGGGSVRPGSGGGGGGGAPTGGGAVPVDEDLGCPEEEGAFACNLVDDTPEPAEVVPTAAVAEMARDQLTIPTPTIHTAPSPRTYVKVRTSLWIDRQDFAPRVARASAGGQTVTATAEPQSVVWNMGENTVTCTTAGSPKGTDCGYTYNRSSAGRPGGAYTISATITWRVTWTCTGACDQAGGTLDDMSSTSTSPLIVSEIQTNTRD